MLNEITMLDVCVCVCLCMQDVRMFPPLNSNLIKNFHETSRESYATAKHSNAFHFSNFLPISKNETDG